MWTNVTGIILSPFPTHVGVILKHLFRRAISFTRSSVRSKSAS